MYQLLNITKGDDIVREVHVHGCGATTQEIEGWVAGEPDAEGPRLEKFYPDWVSGIKSDWNYKCMDIFARDFLHSHSEGLGATEDIVKVKYAAKFKYLKGLASKVVPAAGETEEQAAARVAQATQMRAAKDRRNRRRKTVSSSTFPHNLT